MRLLDVAAHLGVCKCTELAKRRIPCTRAMRAGVEGLVRGGNANKMLRAEEACY